MCLFAGDEKNSFLVFLQKTCRSVSPVNGLCFCYMPCLGRLVDLSFKSNLTIKSEVNVASDTVDKDLSDCIFLWAHKKQHVFALPHE